MIVSKTIGEHLVHIAEMLDLIFKYKLKLKITKYDFVQFEICLLGHIVGKDGLKVGQRSGEYAAD